MKINMLWGVGILVAGIGLGVGGTFLYPQIREKVQPQSTFTNEMEIKKQSLAAFYKKLSTSLDSQDWATVYSLAPKSIRDYLTKEQFVSYQERLIENQKRVYSKSKGKFIDAFVSRNTVINSVEVDGDKGFVDRTIITCLTNECAGNNRKEDRAKKAYTYAGGEWQILDPQPSAKALEVASYIYLNSSSADKKYLSDNYGYGTDSVPFITRGFALFLDQSPEKLALAEAWVDQNKADRSKPVVNYQAPAVIQQPAPVIQQQTYPKNCTSNTIGSFTYTNCY